MRYARAAIAVLAAITVAGCGGSDSKDEVAVDAPALSPGCYTVDLFDPFTIKAPPPEIAEEADDFLGVWMNGAWDGKWCHDLYVTSVNADGSVEVLDAYGPYVPAGVEATVFRREGHLKDGVLTLHSQGATVTYHRDGAYLVGTRKGAYGDFDIIMSREKNVAIGEPVMLPRGFKHS